MNLKDLKVTIEIEEKGKPITRIHLDRAYAICAVSSKNDQFVTMLGGDNMDLLTFMPVAPPSSPLTPHTRKRFQRILDCLRCSSCCTRTTGAVLETIGVIENQPTLVIVGKSLEAGSLIVQTISKKYEEKLGDE